MSSDMVGLVLATANKIEKLLKLKTFRVLDALRSTWDGSIVFFLTGIDKKACQVGPVLENDPVKGLNCFSEIIEY